MQITYLVLSREVMIMNSSHKEVSTRGVPRSWLALIVAVFYCCLLAPAWAEDNSHLLDGKAYVGKNGEVGQKLAEYEDEEITFVDGLFTSISCAPYNFSSSPYQTRVIDGKIHFDAVTDSANHGMITWSGIIDGDEAEMTFVWTKERWYWDSRREYWFHGKLKN